MSPGDRVGARGVPRCRRPPTTQGSSCAFPTGGRREFGRGRGQRRFPRRSSGRDRARGAIFNVFGHQSLRSLGTRACGAPGSCWDSAASGPLAPREDARPGWRGSPCGPVGLPSRASPGAFPSHPGLVGAGGAASPQTSALAPMPAAMMDRWLCRLGSGNPPSSGPPARDSPFFELRLGCLRGPPSALAISLPGPQVDLEKRGSPPSEQIREHGAWAAGGRPSRPAEPGSGPGWFCPELFPCIRVT